MSLPMATVIGMLSDNLRLRGSVVPLSTRRSTRWAQGLNLARGGPTVLYTGQTYQLMPYLEALSRVQKKAEAITPERLARLGRPVNRLINVTGIVAWPTRAEREYYDQILVDITAVLRSAGVEFGYLYGDDLYSGALVHDLGLDDVVRLQALRIRDTLTAHRVTEVITVDPHTTNMMRAVLPSLVTGFDVRVRHYLEVLAEQSPLPRRDLGQNLAIHDSCLMARAENVIEQPRALLRGAGAAVHEPEQSGQLTWCCGGPAESLYPEKAHANAKVRVGQLQLTAKEAVTMCPICLVNLRNAADGSVELKDISHYLRHAYTG